jgi:regulator of RNase E activity RraA
VAAQAPGIARLVIDGALWDIEAIGGRTKKETGVPSCPIELGGAFVRPGARDCAKVVYMRALKTRENEKIMIENLRKGKTTLELSGLGGAE